jgi:hypothetical protein
MPIQVPCPKCGKSHSFAAQHAGKTTKCRECGAILRIAATAKCPKSSPSKNEGVLDPVDFGLASLRGEIDELLSADSLPPTLRLMGRETTARAPVRPAIASRATSVTKRNKRGQQPAVFPGDLLQAYSETRNVADKVTRVRTLLSRGADPNVREQRGHPLLHMAVNDGHLEVVRLLLNHGADVNATNPTGSTALHIAASWDDGEMVQLLLGYKPNVNARNKSGRTPLDSAELAGPATVTASGRPTRGGAAQLLRRRGALRAG